VVAVLAEQCAEGRIAFDGSFLTVAVVASLFAIWDFTGKDTLWRTVATCDAGEDVVLKTTGADSDIR